MILQALVILFALFAISRAYLRLRESKLQLGQFLFWTILWIGAVVIVFLPDIAGVLSQALGIHRPIDAIVYASIVLLFYLTFRLYVKLSDIEQEITTLVSELAKKK